jgi:hypothetical protein
MSFILSLPYQSKPGPTRPWGSLPQHTIPEFTAPEHFTPLPAWAYRAKSNFDTPYLAVADRTGPNQTKPNQTKPHPTEPWHTIPSPGGPSRTWARCAVSNPRPTFSCRTMAFLAQPHRCSPQHVVPYLCGDWLTSPNRTITCHSLPKQAGPWQSEPEPAAVSHRPPCQGSNPVTPITGVSSPCSA